MPDETGEHRAARMILNHQQRTSAALFVFIRKLTELFWCGSGCIGLMEDLQPRGTTTEM